MTMKDNTIIEPENPNVKTVIVTNYTVNGKYRANIKREPTKGVIGYTVEVNSDDKDTLVKELQELKDKIEPMAVENIKKEEKRNDNSSNIAG